MYLSEWKVGIHLENAESKSELNGVLKQQETYQPVSSSQHASLAVDPEVCLIRPLIDYSGKGLVMDRDCDRIVTIPTFVLPYGYNKCFSLVRRFNFFH